MAVVCLVDVPDGPILGRNANNVLTALRQPAPGQLYQYHLDRIAWMDELVARHGIRRALTVADLKDGLLYVLRTPALLAPMWLAFLINLTAYPASNGLLPYVAKNIYLVDARSLGWLVASFSLGGLLASIATVVTGGPRHPERSMLVYSAVWYVVLLGFGHAGTLGAGLFALVLAGVAQNVAMISMMASLLAAAGDRFRGRVMGVRMLAVYGLPLELMASGALIDLIGYSLTITAFAAVGLLFTLLIGIKWRASLWQRPARLTSH